MLIARFVFWKAVHLIIHTGSRLIKHDTSRALELGMKLGKCPNDLTDSSLGLCNGLCLLWGRQRHLHVRQTGGMQLGITKRCMDDHLIGVWRSCTAPTMLVQGSLWHERGRDTGLHGDCMATPSAYLYRQPLGRELGRDTYRRTQHQHQKKRSTQRGCRPITGHTCQSPPCTFNYVIA